MIYSSYGIIIQSIRGSKHKFAFLDSQKGRINGITAVSTLSIGSLLSYTIRAHRSSYFIENIQLLYLPLSLARTDLLFLHHVLELLYYFAPIESCVTGVFGLLRHLYTADHETMTLHHKKLLLLKLFTLLGIVPDNAQIRAPKISQLSMMHLDQINSENIDQDTEKKLDKWLWYCIYQHPYVNEFKTVHFLGENRIP